MKVLPWPWTLDSLISPPSSTASSRLMARPRPVPPYLRDVPASACWKASKMSRCFSGATPMPVSSTAKATTCGALLSTGWSGLQPLRGEIDAHLDVAVGGELDGVGEQVLEDLLEALGVAVHGARQVLGEVDVERQVLGLGHVAEVAVDGVAQAGEGDLLDLDRDGAGLDLREVENVVDQVEQVGAGRVDVAGELDLLVGEVAGGVLGELLAEDQDRVERRAQLVRHVGQELGLVLRGERQLGGLFLQRVAGLLDLGVLALDLGVLLGQQPGLGAQLLVGLLQLALARLQLDGELLRLRQQALGAHRRLDGVEHGADALRELIEEGEVDRR